VYGPLLVNMLARGKTPILPLRELERRGYKIAVSPIESLLVTARAVQRLCRTFLDEGRVDHLVPERMADFAEVKQLLGLDGFLAVRSGLESEPPAEGVFEDEDDSHDCGGEG
jgi:2-methylisocitrate lyase-like PEP mutase family enzyme